MKARYRLRGSEVLAGKIPRFWPQRDPRKTTTTHYPNLRDMTTHDLARCLLAPVLRDSRRLAAPWQEANANVESKHSHDCAGICAPACRSIGNCANVTSSSCENGLTCAKQSPDFATELTHRRTLTMASGMSLDAMGGHDLGIGSQHIYKAVTHGLTLNTTILFNPHVLRVIYDCSIT
jgi:hypothetical protein